MSETADRHQRTEEPTQKRLEDARRKGDAPRSQELVSTVMLGAGALALWLLAEPAARRLAALGAHFIERPHAFATDGAALTRLFSAVAFELAAAGAGFAVVLLAAAILVNLVQARPVFTAQRLAPRLSKISPAEGFKRIFGSSGLFNFVKGIFKLAIVGALLVYALWPERARFAGLIDAGAGGLLALGRSETLRLVGTAISAMAVIAALDFAFQRHAWRARLRMTREEVRRELKESEGDPLIRGRLRRQREARARRRMVAAVQNATVLVMNPTHFAVALKYEEGQKGAPVCLAKGADETALRMREAARTHGVTVVENPPLARALFAGAEIGEEIPVEHYEAVAGVIGFVLSKARVRRPTLQLTGEG